MVNSKSNSSRKNIIDKVSGMLQVLITNYEVKTAGEMDGLSTDQLIKLTNKSAGDIVQVVLDYERAKGLGQIIEPFTIDHMTISKEGYDAGYSVGYNAAVDEYTGHNDNPY